MPPLISVVMPVYNGANLVREAIRSILDQTFRDFEFIIVDDGSTDDTASIIKSFDDPRIQFISLDINRGISHALNLGISMASGKMVARIDSDDMAMPQRLERQLTFMERHPAVGLSGCSVRWINEAMQMQSTRYAVTESALCRATLVFGMPFHHPTWMVRKEIYEHLAYRAEWEPTEDWDFMIEAAHITTLAGLHDTLMWCLDHPGRITRMHTMEQAKNDILIAQRVLERIGIHWTHKQITTWYGFARFDAKSPIFALDELEALTELVSQLLEANRLSGYLDQQSLHTVLAQRWWSLCRGAAIHGMPIFRRYRSSSARWKGLARLVHDVRMLSLCLGIGRNIRLG